MESSALNVAHQLYRRAEAHLKYRRFEDAILCHRKAAEKISEAMQLTNVTRALESLKLQQDYHTRQEEIVRLKQAQFDMYKMAVENQRQQMLNVFAKKEQTGSMDQENESGNLQIAIYRTMEETDSLLELLVRRGVDGDMGSLPSAVEVMETEKLYTGSKLPKDDLTVMEELRTLNQQLRALVMRLMTQLDASQGEVETLQARVRALEGASGGLRVVTDSLGGHSSPFVFSPCGELSPDGNTLPPLTPLDVPAFNYPVLVRRPSNADH